MKIKIIVMLIGLSVMGMVSAQNSLFDKFSEMDGVNSVYISKALLSMMSSVNSNGINISGMANKLETVCILTSEKEETALLMKKETEYIRKSKRYEELMRIKDEESRISFYIKKEGEIIRELVMLVDEKSEFVIIQLLGAMELKDIQAITEGIK